MVLGVCGGGNQVFDLGYVKRGIFFKDIQLEMLSKHKVEWLRAEVSTFFSRGPDSNYFQLCRPCVVSVIALSSIIVA